GVTFHEFGVARHWAPCVNWGMRWSLGGLVVLLGGREALAKVTVKPGRYFLVNRDFGTFLRDEGLGLRDDDALWSIEPQDGGFRVKNLKTQRPLGHGFIETWQIHQVCRGSSIALVASNGEVLAVQNASGAHLVAAEKAGRGAQWLLVPPCLGEDPQEVESLGWGECFPKDSGWGSMAEDCCNSVLHGPGGNPTCWDGHYTFQRCCPNEAQKAVPLSGAEALNAAPRLLCSGERLRGGTRFVRQASFDGERMWHPSQSFDTTFDFADQAESGKLVQVATGLPRCGGPDIFEEAGSILEVIEQHHMSILKDLHEAMMKLSARPTRGGVPSVTYLPFFPYLLMALHRRTGRIEFLNCIAQTAAVL
ncbi:unnamed protein product, partial [Durusdinium trenchii]